MLGLRRISARFATLNSQKNLYEVLGVSPSSSAEEIKRQYLRLAKELHPDVNKDAA